MPEFKRDKLYQVGEEKAVDKIVDFAFDDQVASVFPDMVHRSVPGYSTVLRLWQAVFACEFGDENVHVLDLGCSLGAVTLALADVLPNAHFTAVDLSEGMLSRCQQACERANISERVQCELADITLFESVSPVNAITLNLVMQFIEPEQRDMVMQRYADMLPSGGVLAITEKVRETDEALNRKIIRWHEQFKRNNGYSELEIASKRTAIEHVMRIDTPEIIESRLRSVGFSDVTMIAQGLSFRSWIAEK